MYILDFFDIGKEVIWGGDRLAKNYKKTFDTTKNIGESFEISVIPSMQSIVQNGKFKGISLKELTEKYKEDILGDLAGGREFPLLIKLIDARERLSIQVHPDNEYAKKNYNSLGKNEMWSVLDAEENSQLLIGFKEGFTKNDLKNKLKNSNNGSDNSIEEIFNFLDIKKGDSVYIPAGCIHAILGGVVIAEIQTSSDLTFRVYDWGRVDKNGEQRGLHIKEALDVVKDINAKKLKVEKSFIKYNGYEKASLIENEFFKVEEINIEEGNIFECSMNKKSFEIIMTVEGEANIDCVENEVFLYKTKTVLIPASLKSYKIKSKKYTKVLRIKV